MYYCHANELLLYLSCNHLHIFVQVGHITVAGPLDRETVSEYQVIVIARDRATVGSQLEVGIDQLSHRVTYHHVHFFPLYLPLQTIATVTVNITDVNDNIPQFSSDSYTTSFPEDVPLTTVLLVVS